IKRRIPLVSIKRPTKMNFTIDVSGTEGVNLSKFIPDPGVIRNLFCLRIPLSLKNATSSLFWKTRISFLLTLYLYSFVIKIFEILSLQFRDSKPQQPKPVIQLRDFIRVPIFAKFP